MWTNKQIDRCLYSSHDGSRDGDVRSFGAGVCESSLLVVVCATRLSVVKMTKIPTNSLTNGVVNRPWAFGLSV